MSRVIPSSSHRLFFAFFVIWHPEGTALWHRSSSGFGKYSSTNPLYKSFDYYHLFLETATAHRRYRYQTVLYRRRCFHYDRLILSAHCTYFATVFGLALLLGGIWSGDFTRATKKRYIISYIERVSFLIGDGVCGVLLLRFIGWERSLSVFLLRLSRNSIGSGGQVSVCEQR